MRPVGAVLPPDAADIDRLGLGPCPGFGSGRGTRVKLRRSTHADGSLRRPRGLLRGGQSAALRSPRGRAQPPGRPEPPAQRRVGDPDGGAATDAPSGPPDKRESRLALLHRPRRDLHRRRRPRAGGRGPGRQGPVVVRGSVGRHPRPPRARPRRDPSRPPPSGWAPRWPPTPCRLRSRPSVSSASGFSLGRARAYVRQGTNAMLLSTSVWRRRTSMRRPVEAVKTVTMNTPKDRLERFLNHLDGLTGQEPIFYWVWILSFGLKSEWLRDDGRSARRRTCSMPVG